MNTESIFPVLLELLAKSAAAIALAATLLLRGWREVTAAQRHLVWFVALTTVTLLPLTRLVSPRWAIAMQPAHKVSVTMPALAPVSVKAAEMESALHETVAPVAVHTPIDWRRMVLGCWLSGALLVLGRRFVGSWRLRWLLARSIQLNDERVRAMAARIFAELGIRRQPNVCLSAECRVPITWGVLRPRMLLPVASVEWSDAWLTAALRHECAHIRRHDYLARWVAHLACAIYWPNPFVWLLARSLRLAQEQAADDLVLRAGTPADDYATQLVEAARMVAAHGFVVRQAVAMACPSTLEHRVRAIVDGRRDRRPLSMLAASMGSAAIAFALALCTATQLVGAEQPPAPAPEPSVAGGTAGENPRAKEPQIRIETEFFEIEPDVFENAGIPQADVDKAIFSDPQFQIIFRTLSQKKGGELLSSPRIVTRSNQRSVIEVVREFRYPASWEKDAASGGWKTKEFQTKNVGVTVELAPKIQADGTIAMPVNGKLVEFLGYVDLDNGKKTSANKARPGEIIALETGLDAHGDLPDLRGTANEGRVKAIFSERAIKDTISLKSGETVALSGFKQVSDVRPFEPADPQRKLIVFITASVIDAEPHVTLVDAPVAAEKASAPPAQDKDTEEAASKIIIPEIELREATLQDAVAVLAQKSQEVQPGGEHAVSVAAEMPADMKTPRITLSLKNIPLLEAARFVANLADLQVVVRHGVIVLSAPQPAGTAATGPGASAKQLVTKEWKVPTNLIPAKTGSDGVEHRSAKDWLVANGVEFGGNATAVYIIQSSRLIMRNTPNEINRVDRLIAEWVPALTPTQEAAKAVGPTEAGPTMTKAKSIIIPKFELREASLAEAVEALRAKAKEFDPEKKGVNLVVKPGATSNASITLWLSNIPLIEAVHYVAGLANLEFEVHPEAIVFLPGKANVGSGEGPSSKANAAPAPPVPPAGAGSTALPDNGGATAGTITLSGGVLQVIQDSPPSAGPAKSGATVEPGKAKEETGPVEITSFSSRMENGIAVAEGEAVLKWGEQTMKADQIRYDPTTRQVDLTGKVEIKNGTSVQKAERVTLWLTPDGRKKIEGPKTVSVLAPPAAAPKETVTITNATIATAVAMTLGPKGTFKDNDGIEIRETTGTNATFRVGGTYRVRGVCRQSSLEHAVLLVSNSAAGDGEAIKPVDGTSLSRDVPKGHTEFEFAFTPTRPGKLHITIYDMDNHNPADNAYAGIYLGEIAP